MEMATKTCIFKNLDGGHNGHVLMFSANVKHETKRKLRDTAGWCRIWLETRVQTWGHTVTLAWIMTSSIMGAPQHCHLTLLRAQCTMILGKVIITIVHSLSLSLITF